MLGQNNFFGLIEKMPPVAVTGGDAKAGRRGWSWLERREANPLAANWNRRRIKVVFFQGVKLPGVNWGKIGVTICRVRGAKPRAEMGFKRGNLLEEAAMTGNSRTGEEDIRLDDFHN